MKFRVKVEDRWYNAEIRDLNARPVEVWVDGERFEVWPEAEGLVHQPSRYSAEAPESRAANGPVGVTGRPSSQGFKSPPPRPAKGQTISPADNGVLQQVRAPIPGIVISVAVQPESQVEPGDQLCVLEAMKMNNVIRAARAGTIAAVHISPGQQVAHRQLLMEFNR